MSVKFNININVRGTVFQTSLAKFKAFPNSRLANLSITDNNFDAVRNEFCFDRNPILFHFILDSYDTGELHLPKHICSRTIKRELKFWKLGKEILGKCCIKTFYSDDEEIAIYEQFEMVHKQYQLKNEAKSLNSGRRTLVRSNSEENKMETTEPSKQRRRQQIWHMVSDPFSSWLSRVYFTTIVVCVILSIAIYAMSTLRQFRQPRERQIMNASIISNPKLQMYSSTRAHRALSVIDFITNTILVVDFCLIFYSFPNRIRFLKNFLTVLDFFVLLSVYCLNIFEQTDHIHENLLHFFSAWAGIVYCFRVLRVMRFYSFSKGWMALYMSFVASKSIICFFLIGFFFACLLSASLVYQTELWSPRTFPNMFVSVWWAVVTLSTVGYGDTVPQSTTGKVITVVLIILGVLLITVPYVIITNNYGTYYACYENFKRHEKVQNEDEDGDDGHDQDDGEHLSEYRC